MPDIPHNKVYQLISTLSRAEKRHFRLYTHRTQENTDSLFIQVFDMYLKYGMVKDAVLLKKIPEIKPSQLSNIRNNLYKQLLTALRLQNQKNTPDIAIRQEIDFATVLYDKGLYRHALDVLSKAKKIAKEQNRNVLALEVLFFEKAIESQNITKSIGDRASELAQESTEMLERLEAILHYSNLDLSLYSYYLSEGFCKSNADRKLVEQRFKKAIIKLKEAPPDFYTDIYYYQCRCWYSYIRQDFKDYQEAANSWVSVFDHYPTMIKLRPVFYLKGLHNAISGAFINGDNAAFQTHFDRLTWFKKDLNENLTWNEQGLYELYFNIHKLDQHFKSGDFEAYLEKKEELEQLIETNPYHWDKHRLAIFRYKLACLLFGEKQYEEAIDQFNEIRKLYKPGSRSMVLRFVKILSAFAHLMLGNIQLVVSLIQSLKKDLLLTKQKHEPLENTLVKLLEKLVNVPVLDRGKEIEKVIQELKELEKDTYTQIAFLHFYAVEWLESLVQKKKASTVMAEKAAGTLPVN